MPKAVMALIIMLIVLPAAPLAAKVINIDDMYTIDVPGNWSMEADGNLLMVISPDKKAVIFVTHSISVHFHKSKVAKVAEEKFPKLVKEQSDRWYTVTRGSRERRIIVTIIGDHRDRTKIYYSIKEK